MSDFIPYLSKSLGDKSYTLVSRKHGDKGRLPVDPLMEVSTDNALSFLRSKTTK